MLRVPFSVHKNWKNVVLIAQLDFFLFFHTAYSRASETSSKTFFYIPGIIFERFWKKKFFPKNDVFFLSVATNVDLCQSVSQSVRLITLHSPNGEVLWAQNGLKKSGIIWECAFRRVFDSTYLGSCFMAHKGGSVILLRVFFTGTSTRVVCWMRYRFRSVWRVEFSSAWILTLTLYLHG
jgi:hypothetical protein